MTGSKLVSIFKEGHLVIPLYLLQSYKKFNIELNDFIFLMYLYNLGDGSIFNPGKFANDLGCELADVMVAIGTLTEKKLVRVEVVKNDKGLMEEVILLDDFYNKLSLLVMDDVNKTSKSSSSNIFEIVEREFGRTLSPNELEFIKAWLDTFDKDVILEAVKEATLNGVSSIRYIDKILYEWDRKGIKKKEDVEHFLNLKKQEEKEPVEVFDYDWFDEDDEEWEKRDNF